MADAGESRVAVYIDFDNIVISEYDAVHGRGSFVKERARNATGKTADRLSQATVNVGAVLDYASSFGTIATSRAYADWSAAVNHRYQSQLVGRAVELTQLFSTSGTKNGADIRLSIDVVEDLFRLPDITHVVIVAGDSDYIPLAQSARRLGRVVVGIGVRGSTSTAFKNACDEFAFYQDLPEALTLQESIAEEAAPDPQRDATDLLLRALRVGRPGDDDWMAAGGVKQQMKRLESSFDEKTLGFKSFTDFLKARATVVDVQEDGQSRRVRLRTNG